MVSGLEPLVELQRVAAYVGMRAARHLEGSACQQRGLALRGRGERIGGMGHL